MDKKNDYIGTIQGRVLKLEPKIRKHGYKTDRREFAFYKKLELCLNEELVIPQSEKVDRIIDHAVGGLLEDVNDSSDKPVELFKLAMITATLIHQYAKSEKSEKEASEETLTVEKYLSNLHQEAKAHEKSAALMEFTHGLHQNLPEKIRVSECKRGSKVIIRNGWAEIALKSEQPSDEVITKIINKVISALKNRCN